VQIAQALLASAAQEGRRERILCLCYTNHALDDFLLSLHEDGMPLEKFLRIGRSPKINDKLRNRCLQEMSDVTFDRMQSKRFGILKQQEKDCESQLPQLLYKISRQTWGPKWSQTALEFLKDDGDESTHHAFLELELPKGDHHTTKVVGKNGKAIGEGYLWEQWCAGVKRPTLLVGWPRYTPPPGTASIWDLTKDARKALIVEWQGKWIAPFIEQTAHCLQRFDEVKEAISILRSETKVLAARQALVVGCTTTAAAKHSNLLAQLQPTIVIIEEAAEILEANVLTSLGPSVRQLIMVGDHKQLRPKLESYSLRKESGGGVDFDVSLFERLANQEGFPVHTLSIQHRMRPEISELIRRSTYLALEDHPSVRGRDDIRGVSSNVIFVSHDKLESNDDEKVVLGISSKVNLHEVDLVLSILKYLLQQGYVESDIVILTPYLGQLMLIRDALMKRTRIGVSIGSLDRGEIKKLDPTGDVSDSTGKEKGSDGRKKYRSLDASEAESDTTAAEAETEALPTVRVATVDNFQGEEARIIIGSLVRSNSEGDIGFVSGAERVNVLLSRARDGLVLIGNENTLRNARSARGRELWTGVLDQLKEQKSVFQGFPARCENHKTSPPHLLCTAEDFARYVPDGGCSHPCGFVLASCSNDVKHVCAMKCHPCLPGSASMTLLERQTAFHADLSCTVLLEERCPATVNSPAASAHYVKRVCYESLSRPCLQDVIGLCPEGHVMHRTCSEKANPRHCRICREARRMAEKQARDAEARVLALQKAEGERESAVLKLEEERRLLAEEKQMEMIQHETDLLHEELKKVQNTRTNKRKRSLKSGGDHPVSRTVIITDLSPEEPDPAGVFSKNIGIGPIATIGEGADGSLATADDAPYTAICDDADFITGDLPSGDDDQGHVASGGDMDLSIDAPAKKRSPIVVPQITKSSLKQMFTKATALLRLAEKENWAELYRLSEEASLCEGFLSTIAKACAILCQVYLGEAGEKQFLAAEALVQERKADVDEPWFNVCSTVTSYVYFLVAHKNSKLRLTAASYANQFLQAVTLTEAAKDQSWAVSIPTVWVAFARTESEAARSNPQAARSDTTYCRGEVRTASTEWKYATEIYLKKPRPRSESGTASAKSSPSVAMDTLMGMTGLESVKNCMLEQYHRITLASEQGAGGASSYNTRFDGNPGTGKTTVARHYAKFLREVGVLPEESIIKETTGSKLISIGVRGLTSMLDEIKEVGGGVVFVDEAYQLNPQNDREGRQVLDFLLVHAERMRGEYGSVVWVFAGYKKDMEKLFEHNPGLPSRFLNHFNFDDYSDAELLQIFDDILKRGGLQDDAGPPANAAKKKQAPASLPMASASNASAYAYANGSQPDQIDEWGNLWKWNSTQSTFVDEYDNVSGYGTNSLGKSLGSQGNPVVSRKDNSMWYYNRSTRKWSDNSVPKRTRDLYPGMPVPEKPAATPRPFTVSDPKWSRIAIRRLGRGRGTVGFGNARAVRNFFEATRNRQAARIEKLRRSKRDPNIFMLERNDLLGPKADRHALESNEAYKKLMAMEGLVEVKNAVNKLLDLVEQNAKREDSELPMMEISLNRIFLGNPGTGKTSVARLYASILAGLGLLSKGEVLLKNSSDFIGSALGTSESITRSILAQAEGNVLVIDEAYGLNPCTGGGLASGGQDPYKTAVIDTIVEQVQGGAGEDRAVVMIGYRKEMTAMMAVANPGLSRRFQMENAFEFADYDDGALIRILRASAKESGLAVGLSTAIFAVKQLAKARALPNFGNAGAVNNLLSVAKLNFQARTAKTVSSRVEDRLVDEDFCRDGKLPMHSAAEDILSDLTGCDQILGKLKGYRNTIQLARQQGKDPKSLVEFNFLFVGSPGTG
jgi:SpoVK/Ycf46/Vps4 family AAA+-type ATPase